MILFVVLAAFFAIKLLSDWLDANNPDKDDRE